MYTENTFRQRCEEATKRFLHSVVVIDNEARLYDSEIKEKGAKKKTISRRPASGLSAKKLKDAETLMPVSGKTDTEGEDEAPDIGGDQELRAWVLTAGLADKDILCTIYRPDDHPGADNDNAEDDVVKRSVSMARLADIVVLDWELGDELGKGSGSWKARDIIKHILRADSQAQGRLRLIIVYTAQSKLGSTFQDVRNDLKGCTFVGGKLKENVDNLVIQNQTTKIVFLNKRTTKLPEDNNLVVSEEELPKRIIEEFANLSSGLIPSITLHSIAAIRETTHHLLATFNGSLDPALVCHRALLPAPKDSEDFVLDLIAGELRSALSLNRIGEKYADEIAHKHWIGSKVKEDEVFKLPNDLSLTRDEALSLAEGGQGNFEKVQLDATKRWAKAKIDAGDSFKLSTNPNDLNAENVSELIDLNMGKDLNPQLQTPRHGNLTGLLCGDEKKGVEINNEFSRLTTLKREKYGSRHLPDQWAPRLTQGTIIRGAGPGDKPVFLLCTQPRCDSVRLKKTREFPFLILEKGGSGPQGTKQMLIIRVPGNAGEKPVDIKVWVSPFPHQQKMLPFDPKNSPFDVIEATKTKAIRVNSEPEIAPFLGEFRPFRFNNNPKCSKEDDQWVFNDGNRNYEWIADLNDFLAQKICDQVSGRQGTVGLDEYEWLRRQGHA